MAQRIKKFLQEDVPVSMGLIVDNSGSMDTKRQEVALVEGSNTQDEVFIVNFNEAAFLEQPFDGRYQSAGAAIADQPQVYLLTAPKSCVSPTRSIFRVGFFRFGKPAPE